jgi:hypothetical protein
MPTIVFASSKGGAGKSFGGSLADLDLGQVGNVSAAQANAHAFTAEVLAIMKPAAKVGEAA